MWVLVGLCAAGAQAQTLLGTLNSAKQSAVWQPATGASLEFRHDDLGLFPEDLIKLRAVFDTSGLVTAAGTTRPAGLALETAMPERDQARVTFRAAAPGFAEEVRWVAGDRASIAMGDFWPGSIVVFDGSVIIGGEVAGHVIAIGANVTVREAAVVRGDVIVIGGVLRQRGDGKIYGNIFAPGGHRRPRLSISRAWEFEEEGFGWKPQLSYDRVDGLRLGTEGRYLGSAFQPQVRAMGAYAFASETWQFRFEVRQRLLRTVDLELAGRVFRLTDTEDEMWVGRDENTAFALAAGSDYRDYYGIDGGEVEAIYKYRERGQASITYRNTDYRWLDAETNLWHLFRPDHDFRENFSTAPVSALDSAGMAAFVKCFERQTSAVILSAKVDPKDTEREFSAFNGTAKATFEVAGGGLGGDFDYDRFTFDASSWWESGRWHQLSLRFFYGLARRNVPPHKQFYLGGIGSLRGYRQKAFVGDVAALGTVEYRFDYWINDFLDGGLILFFDAGRAGAREDFWEFDGIKSDVGFGLGFGDGLRLDVAKGLDHSDRDIRVTFRLSAKP